MKNIITGISFAFAIPFIVLGFVWNFIAYCFEKGREVCNNFFEYLD